MSKPDNITIYDANARQLAARYESTTTEAALTPFTHILSNYAGTRRTALDIGSGSGRDALWIANQGWYVDAVDGSMALLNEAKRLNSHPNITFIHDLAPDFRNVRGTQKQYSVILMSAFIFHFDQTEREIILRSCLEMLSSEGLIYITLRNGPAILNRNIYSVPPEEIIAFAQRHDLSSHYHGHIQDSAGADGISWDHVSLWRGTAWDHAKECSL